MKALHTDLYELTMSAGYFASGKTNERGVFEMFVRRLPERRPFLIAAGLAQVVEYLLALRFTGEQVVYLRGLPVFEHTPPAFWEYLREFRFTGDLFAMPEGTPFFAGEPVLIVRAPMIEAQLGETFLLASVGFQSMIAAKAARVVKAANGKPVSEFGARRAHGPEAGVLAGRAAYLGGCAGTSNVEAGFRFGVPLYGTCAHSWILAFEDETVAFRQLQKLLRERTIYLIDTYDTVEGARKAVSLGRPLKGVRLDSGDIVSLSRQVREVLDAAGMNDVKIMVTSDLDEDRIADLLNQGAPIDAFGVGTALSTSVDAPAVSAVYKLAEHQVEGGIKRFTAKYSPEKQSMPGAKQVFRFQEHDLIGVPEECPGGGEALLRPVLVGGQLVEPLPTLNESRDFCAASIARRRPGHRVEYSQELKRLSQLYGKREG